MEQKELFAETDELVMVTVWFDRRTGWCVSSDSNKTVFVHNTKRSALKYAERLLDQQYGESN